MDAKPMPVVIVFAGGSHPATCMDAFIKSLRENGYPAESHALRTLGTPFTVIDDDEVHMRSMLMPHIEQGKDVVLIVHSMAGFGGTAAITGLDKGSRFRIGKRGGLIGVIYLAAFIPRKELTLCDMTGGMQPVFTIFDASLMTIPDPIPLFYNDCDPGIAEATAKTLLGQSPQSMRSKPSSIGWVSTAYDGRRAYIHCEQDMVIPPDIQRAMVKASGVKWIVKSLNASHSPFLSMPDQTAIVVAELLDAFYAAE